MSNLTLVIQGDPSGALAAVNATGTALDTMGTKGVSNSRLLVEALAAQKTAVDANSAALLSLTDKLSAAVGTRAVKAANDGKAALVAFGDAGEMSAKQIAVQMKYLPKQFDDAFRSISAGASPMSVLMTQGSQLRDMFGGVRPALSAVGSLLTPTAVGFGALAVTVGGLAYALSSGADEAKVMDTALRSNGNWAGLTRGQLDSLSVSVARNGDITIGTARQISAALVEAGQLSGPALGAAATAVATLTRVTGKSVDDVVTSLSGLADKPAEAALKLNSTYRFLTPTVYEQVAALQAQGKQQEAARVVLDALNTEMAGRAVPTLGTIERATKAVAEGFSAMWTAAKGMGAPETVEQQLARVEGQMDAMQRRRARTAENDFAAQYMDPTGAATLAPSALMGQQVAALRQAAQYKQAAAAADAENAQLNAEKLEELSAQHQSALIGIESSGAAVRLAQTQSSLANERSAIDLALQERRMSAREYQTWVLALDLQTVDAELANIARLRAAEAGRKGLTDKDAVLAQQAALQKYDAQTIAAKARRDKIIADEVAGKRDVSGEAGPRTMLTPEVAAVQAGLKARVVASDAAEAEMLASTKATGIALIEDTRARGMAQIALDQETLTKRLDLAAQSAADRERIEGELADWRLGREKQLDEQLKPQWKRLTDGWADTTRLMKDTSDKMLTDFVTGSEDAFATFVTTGQLNIRQLATTWIAELARMEFRKTFAPSILSLGQSALSFLGMGFGGGGSTAALTPGIDGSLGDLISAATVGMGFHSGGIAGGPATFTRSLPASTWSGAPRYHTGGLAGDEVAAVLLKGEGVFTPGQMRALGKGMAAGSTTTSGGGQQVSVNMPTTIHIDSRTDSAAIAQLVSGAMAATKKSLIADLRSRGVIR